MTNAKQRSNQAGEAAPAKPADSAGRDFEQARPAYRQDWEQRHQPAGGRWEDAERGYRFGHEIAGDARFQGREWDEAVAELPAEWDAWIRRFGYHTDALGWEHQLAFIQEAWAHARGR